MGGGESGEVILAADLWTIGGTVGTVAFGGLAMFQFVRDWKEGAVWRERAKHLHAVKLGLVQFRAMLTEAEQKAEVVKTDDAKQFVRQMGHHIMSIEHHIDGMLETGEGKG